MTREQIEICSIIARHTGAAKKKVREAVREAAPDRVLSVEFDSIPLLIGSSKCTIPLKDMLVYKKIKKSELYSEFVDVCGNYGATMMCFFSGRELIVMYNSVLYDGLGGLFARDECAEEGIAFEPFKSYLTTRCEIQRELD